VKLIFFYILLLFISSCTKRSEVKSEQNSLKLYVLDGGILRTSDFSAMFPQLGEKKPKTLSNPAYLIVHPKGNLLWDTGMADSIFHIKGGLDIWGGSWHVSVVNPVQDQLKEIGLSPESVDYIAFSHLHSDHTGNGRLFKNATLLIEQSLSETAFNASAIQKGYNPNDYQSMKLRMNVFTNELDVFGDGSVRLISTPGHAEGHQVLLVDLPEYGALLLSGDLYVDSEQRANFWLPAYTQSKVETIHSFSKVERLIKSTGVTLWIQHDKAQFDSLKKAPYYYR